MVQEHPEDIQWDKDLIKIFTLDIETTCENGFPDVENLREEIICLTVKNQSNKQILTCKNQFTTQIEQM